MYNFKCNYKLHKRTCGEMDITAVFGTVVPGSSPGRCTTYAKDRLLRVCLLICLDISYCPL